MSVHLALSELGWRAPIAITHAFVLENESLYRFDPSSEAAVDNNTVLSARSVGRWLRQPKGSRGADLGDDDATLVHDGYTLRVLPAAVQTKNLVFTLGTAGSVENDPLRILWQGTEAFTTTINNAAASALLVKPVSTRAYADFQRDASDWILTAYNTLP